MNFSKAKRLRIKFLGLMYLLFISFTVMSLSEDWISSIKSMKDFFNKLETSNIPKENIEFYNKINILIKKFERLGVQQGIELNQETQSIFNKVNTDKIIFKEGLGRDLFFAIKDLYQVYNHREIDSQRKKIFKDLFKDEIIAFKTETKVNNWLIQKFKEVPFDYALILLHEYRLKAIILSQGNISAPGPKTKEPSLILLAECATMTAGDSAFFRITNDSILSVTTVKDGLEVWGLTRIQKAGVTFKPKSAGLHIVTLKGSIRKESVVIEVKPESFIKSADQAIKICYKDLEYKQYLKVLESENVSVRCDQDPTAGFIKNQDSIRFTPKKIGWCSLIVQNNFGVLFHDSVYVKEVPLPQFNVSNTQSNILSKHIFNSNQKISLKATHPAFEHSPYQITNFKIRKIGDFSEELTFQGNMFDNSQWKNRQNVYHLGISEITYKVGNQKYVHKDPILLSIQ